MTKYELFSWKKQIRVKVMSSRATPEDPNVKRTSALLYQAWLFYVKCYVITQSGARYAHYRDQNTFYKVNPPLTHISSWIWNRSAFLFMDREEKNESKNGTGKAAFNGHIICSRNELRTRNYWCNYMNFRNFKDAWSRRALVRNGAMLRECSFLHCPKARFVFFHPDEEIEMF